MSAVTTAPPARLLNIEQAAEYLGVDVRFMRRLILSTGGLRPHIPRC